MSVELPARPRLRRAEVPAEGILKGPRHLSRLHENALHENAQSRTYEMF